MLCYSQSPPLLLLIWRPLCAFTRMSSLPTVLRSRQTRRKIILQSLSGKSWIHHVKIELLLLFFLPRRSTLPSRRWKSGRHMIWLKKKWRGRNERRDGAAKSWWVCAFLRKRHATASGIVNKSLNTLEEILRAHTPGFIPSLYFSVEPPPFLAWQSGARKKKKSESKSKACRLW